jgi:putative transposase
VVVSHETIRQWTRKFGQTYANGCAAGDPAPATGGTWTKWSSRSTGCGTTCGARHYLWRAVDQDGVCLDVLVQRRRNATAAKKFFRKLLKGLRYTPRVLVTDKLGSYQVAHREMLSSAEHRRSK